MDIQGWEIESMKPIFDWGDAAAWAQALGAVAAIWFAGRFGHRDRLRKAADQMQAIRGLALANARLVGAGANAFSQSAVGNNNEIDEFPISTFANMADMLASIPVLDVGAFEAPEVVLALREGVRRMSELVSAQKGSSHGPTADTFNEAQRLAAQAQTVAERIEQWAAKSESNARRWWR